jgi:class 3 adenylate cyclase
MEYPINDDYLEEALEKIERVRNWGPRVISKLEKFIRTEHDEDLFRISPLQWALQNSVDEYEAVDLFLHGAKAGLFYLEWDVICVCCGRISQSLRDLHSLESNSTCKFCFRKDMPNLDDSVQVTFTLSPSVRSLRFHHPDNLSLEEYCLKYLYEPSTILNGMMPVKDALQYVQRHFSVFSPGENITVITEVGVGALSCYDLFGQQSFGLVASGTPTPEVQKIVVKLTDVGFAVSLPEMQPGEFSVGALVYSGTFYRICPGKVVIEFEQRASVRAALLVAFFPIPLEGIQSMQIPATGLTSELVNLIETMKDATVTMQAMPDHTFSSPRLTARRLFASQTFHDLFRAEVFQDTEGFTIKDVTILFTDLKSSTQLYHQIGDLNAYALVREHYGILNTAILNHHGAIVKTIGDAIMANFNHPIEAVGAGLEMLSGIRELNRLNQSSHHGVLSLKIGIHRGAAIAVTLNNRIDYFGQSVNIASRVQGSAGGDEIFLTDEIYRSPEVQDLLQKHEYKIEPILIELRGVEGQVKIYKVTGSNE